MIKNTVFGFFVLLTFVPVIFAADTTPINWWDVVKYEGKGSEGDDLFSYDQEMWNTFEQQVVTFDHSRKKEVKKDLLIKINQSKALLFPGTAQLSSNDIPSIAMELRKPDGTPVQENGIFYRKLIKPSQDFIKMIQDTASEKSPLVHRALSFSK